MRANGRFLAPHQQLAFLMTLLANVPKQRHRLSILTKYVVLIPQRANGIKASAAKTRYGSGMSPPAMYDPAIVDALTSARFGSGSSRPNYTRRHSICRMRYGIAVRASRLHGRTLGKISDALYRIASCRAASRRDGSEAWRAPQGMAAPIGTAEDSERERISSAVTSRPSLLDR